jgi:hypothetical protein
MYCMSIDWGCSRAIRMANEAGKSGKLKLAFHATTELPYCLFDG